MAWPALAATSREPAECQGAGRGGAGNVNHRGRLLHRHLLVTSPRDMRRPGRHPACREWEGVGDRTTVKPT